MPRSAEWLDQDVTSVTARSLPTLGVRLAICAATALIFALAVDLRSGLI